MADDQQPHGQGAGSGTPTSSEQPAYDWLYSKVKSTDPSGAPAGSTASAGSSASASSDAEPTQLIGREDSSVPSPSVSKPEQTQQFQYEHTTPPPAPASTGPTAPTGWPDSTRYQPPERQPPGQQPPGGYQPQGAPPARPGRKRRWWLRALILLPLVWLLFLVAVPMIAWTKMSKVDAEPPGNRPSETPGTTYLLVGSDSRRGLSASENRELGTGGVAVDGGRTDTIMLMHVPSGDGPTLLLSIPRDSFVTVPGFGQNKINAAFTLGGPRLLVRTVENATGVRVDDYVEIGFAGFVKLVNAVGGITICPKQAITDPKADLKVRKGCQDANGKTALGYSRSRKFPLGDISRAEHQREVVNATAKKVASWQTIVLPWRYWKINFAGAESVRVGQNVGPVTMAKFAWAMSHSSSGKKCVVPYTTLGASTSAGSAVLWDAARAKQVFQLIRDDNTKAIRCKLR